MKFRELRIQKPRRPPTASELHFPVRIKVQRSGQQIFCLYRQRNRIQTLLFMTHIKKNTVKGEQ
jgi:hypothetical protein